MQSGIYLPPAVLNQTSDFEHCEDRSEIISQKLVADFLNQTRSHVRCVVIGDGPAPQTVSVATNRSFCDLSLIQQSLTVVARRRWLQDLERAAVTWSRRVSHLKSGCALDPDHSCD